MKKLETQITKNTMIVIWGSLVTWQVIDNKDFNDWQKKKYKKKNVKFVI